MRMSSVGELQTLSQDELLRVMLEEGNARAIREAALKCWKMRGAEQSEQTQKVWIQPTPSPTHNSTPKMN
jgi:hypothetical protein